MNDSLVAMWNLNNVSSLGENNTYIVDMNKFGRHNLTVQAAAVSTVAGKYDGAFKFDGTANAYASKNGAVLSTFPMTYTAWVNPARIGTDMQWLWQGDSNTGPKTQGYVLSNGTLLCESSTDAISTVGSGVGVLTADNWYFVACVFNSTSSRIAYLNGQAGNWHTVTASPNMDQVSIGKALNGDFGRRVPFNGTIDEVRIYNKSLTQEEIQQLYFMNLQKYNSTQWYLYVNQSFNSTQGLSDGTYNYFASAKDTMGNENMTDIRYATIDATPPGINFTLPTPADGSVQLQTSVYLNTTITDISNVSAFFDWNYTLVGYWAMDWYNASGIYDNSSYNSFATFNGGQSTNNISAGKYGQGLNFNASNYYLDVPNRASLNPSAFTIDIWVYSREAGRTQWIVTKDPDCAMCDHSFALGKLNTNKVYFFVDPSADCDDVANIQSDSTIGTDTWIHLVAVYNSTNISLYVNTALQSQQPPATLSNTNANLRIGGVQGTDQICTGRSFNGAIDEVRIYSRALSPEEVNASFNNGAWRLYHNFTNLNTGTYNYSAYAIDLVGNINITTARSVTILSTVPNVTTGPTLTPANPTTIHDLNCSFTVTDFDYSNKLYANVSWIRNSTLMFAFNLSVPNGTAASSVLHNANTTKFDTWNCTVTPFDGTSYGTNISAALGILNNFPDNVTMIYPANGSNVQDRRPLFNWTNSTDPDNDRFNFTVLIDDDINFGSPEVNISTYGTNFTPTNPLPLTGGANTRYFWTVTAYDDTNRTAFNGTVTYTFLVQSVVQIAIRNNTVGFAGLNPMQTDNTEDNSPYPFTVENDGTVMVDVNISQINSDLWRTQSSPSGYFTYKIANFTGEEGAFNWAGSVTSFTNVPIVNVTAIDQLNFTNSTDIARIEINVTVPSAEPAGDRSSNLSFTAVIAE